MIISGSTGCFGWEFGTYESRLVTADDPMLSWDSLETVCRFKDRHRTKLSIPIPYLKPLRPSATGEHVIIVNGDHIRTEALVHSIVTNQWKLTSLDDLTKAVWSETKDRLCLLSTLMPQ